MSSRVLLGSDDVVLLATAAKRSHNTLTETAFAFNGGTDLYLPSLSNWDPWMRVLVAITGTTAGTTDSLTFAIYDADDNAGAFGTPAAASVSSCGGDALAAGTGDAWCLFGVRLQNARPWLRVTTDQAAGTTDTFVVTCRVFGVKAGA